MIAAIIAHLHQTIPELSYIDEDYGQLEALDGDQDNYPLTFPAALIALETIDWTDISQMQQTGLAAIRIRICIDCYDDTHATALNTKKAAQRTEFVHRIHQALQGFRPTEQGNMIRYRSAYTPFNHGIKVYQLDYHIECYEVTEKSDTTMVNRLALATESL